MDAQVSDAIIAAIKGIADQAHPQLRYVAKYGGEVWPMIRRVTPS